MYTGLMCIIFFRASNHMFLERKFFFLITLLYAKNVWSGHLIIEVAYKHNLIAAAIFIFI